MALVWVPLATHKPPIHLWPCALRPVHDGPRLTSARLAWGPIYQGPCLSWVALGPRIVGRAAAQALFQRLLQADGSAMLFEKIGERLLGQLLQRLHAVSRQQSQRVPGLGIEGDELAGLDSGPVGLRSIFQALCHRGSTPLR